MSGVLNLLLAGAASAIKDAYYNLTTLLLNTSSTNGAQNNTFLDSSTNNFTITRNGNTTQGTFTPFSQTGWSAFNVGTASFCQLNNSDYSISTGDFTIEFWMFVTSDKAATCFASAASNPDLTVAMNGGSAGARLPYLEYAGGTTFATAFTNYLNTWTHVAFVRSSGTVTVYQNGVAITSASKAGAVGTTANLKLLRNSGDAGQDFPGYMSNFRICKAAVYTGNFTPSTTNFTTTSQGATSCQLLTFQDNRFVDNSSNAATVTPTLTQVQAFSPFAPTAEYDTAVVGGSGYFDGTGDYLSTPSATALQLTAATAFTIEGWAYPTSFPSTDHGIIGKRAGGAVEWQFFFKNDKTLHFYTGLGDYGSGTAISGFNQWVHCAVTWDLTTLRFFINGVLCSTTHSLILFNTPSTADVTVGADFTNAELWNGYLSGVRLVKGTAVYTSTFTPPTAPLTAITNTSLLTNFTNAGIFDSTAKNVLETVGSAQVSTTQAKWGTTSIAFNGTTDYLKPYYPAPANGTNFSFGTGDFTIEWWMYPTSTPASGMIMDGRGSGASGDMWLINWVSGVINWYVGGNLITSSAVSTNVWTHVAICRSGTSTKMFLNGTQTGSTYTDTKNYTVGNGWPTIGASYNAVDFYTGYLDDLRITKYARYVSNFSVPTAAFPLQ
jgi:hypothetical protein